MTSPLPEVRETEAPPEIRAIYDEFKQATGLPVVNLIYRHLAAIPGALPWVWSLVRDPLLTRDAERAAHRIASGLRVPRLALTDPQPNRLAPADVTGIRAVLDVYHEGNILNLACLTAVLQVLDVPRPRPAREAPPAAGSAQTFAEKKVAAQQSIPPLPKLASLPPDIAALVQSLAQLHGDASTAGVTPSLYLHLAHWPEFIETARSPLASHFADGRVELCRADLCRLAKIEAALLATTMSAGQPRPPLENLIAVREGLEMFTQKVIPEMIVVGLVLRGALSAIDAAG